MRHWYLLFYVALLDINIEWNISLYFSIVWQLSHQLIAQHVRWLLPIDCYSFIGSYFIIISNKMGQDEQTNQQIYVTCTSEEKMNVQHEDEDHSVTGNKVDCYLFSSAVSTLHKGITFVRNTTCSLLYGDCFTAISIAFLMLRNSSEKIDMRGAVEKSLRLIYSLSIVFKALKYVR